MSRSGERPATVGMSDSLADHVGALSGTLENSLDLVFAADAAGRVLFANRAARERWQMRVGGEVAALLPTEVGSSVSRLFEERQSIRLEWGDQGPTGPRHWYSCTLSPLIEGDRTLGYLSVSADVTRLKRSEERLRRSDQLMVDTQGVAHLGTWEWDVSEPTAVWSAELYRIYGLTPETYTPSYDKYLAMVHPDDRARVMEATNRVFQEHIPYSHDERIFRPDGSVRYLHTWAHPALNESGKLIRLVGVCQDITEQKQAEQQVVALNTELERRVAERTKTIEDSLKDLEAFNVMASHDLRAPLFVIQGSCELLLRDASQLPAAAQKNLERIRRSSLQMATLVNDLLTLAQVGQANLVRSRLDLADICREVVEGLRLTEPHRSVSVEIDSPLTCLADRGLIRIALGNLLGNAWKYSARRDEAKIEVGISQDKRAFFVRDNGAGFDMNDAHRLFVPFQRLHSSTDFAGTGIGLAGTQRIIERHGGRIWAEGAVNQGATFFFELPAV